MVAVGGAVGALARYGISEWFPSTEPGFPWATFWINVSGCALIGALLVLIDEVYAAPHSLWRPALATGVLGGYTTFSTYSVETMQLLRGGHIAMGVGYAIATVITALAALYLAELLTRRIATDRARRQP
ncbi:MAG: fluoride efflux transporter CrcB [Mycobacteriales bacterium]